MIRGEYLLIDGVNAFAVAMDESEGLGCGFIAAGHRDSSFGRNCKKDMEGKRQMSEPKGSTACAVDGSGETVYAEDIDGGCYVLGDLYRTQGGEEYVIDSLEWDGTDWWAWSEGGTKFHCSELTHCEASNRLKPCPFCGAERGLYVIENGADYEPEVFCDNCKSSFQNEHVSTVEQVVKAWNERLEKDGL